MTSGNHACEAKPTAGASDPRIRNMDSRRASWKACPVSCAATATAAIVSELPTGWLRRITFARGS